MNKKVKTTGQHSLTALAAIVAGWYFGNPTQEIRIVDEPFDPKSGLTIEISTTNDVEGITWNNQPMRKVTTYKLP